MLPAERTAGLPLTGRSKVIDADGLGPREISEEIRVTRLTFDQDSITGSRLQDTPVIEADTGQCVSLARNVITIEARSTDHRPVRSVERRLEIRGREILGGSVPYDDGPPLVEQASGECLAHFAHTSTAMVRRSSLGAIEVPFSKVTDVQRTARHFGG